MNFYTWDFAHRSVLILFPGDVVEVRGATEDFKVEMLRYSASVLREASLQLEQTVYSLLKKDRCRGASPLVEDIVCNLERSIVTCHKCVTTLLVHIETDSLVFG